jgi:acyl dehydratase
MELGSHIVGTKLKEYRKEVNWRETMNYAAAVGDNNPFYFDDEQAGGIIAHPMFCVAVTWPVTEKLEEYTEPGIIPAGVSATKVHYTEHIEFYRPVKPGDILTVKGEIAAVTPHRAGTHTLIRYDVSDQSGLPVFTEHIGALMRGVTCADTGRGGESLPSIPECRLQDRPVWKTKVMIDPMRPFIYDGCTNIFFPIHTSKQFAKRVGLPGIILQGTATLAYAVKEIVNRETSGYPMRLKILSCRFTGMVIPGTEIAIELLYKLEQENGTEFYFAVINSEGRRSISSGYALISHS